MSLTTDLKDELARIQPATQQAMAAEVATILRFAGGLHLVSGRILIEAELDSPVAARRLRAFLQLRIGRVSQTRQALCCACCAQGR